MLCPPLSACLVLVAAAGCGGGDDSADAIDIEACARLATGPFQDLIPGAVHDSSAPGIDEGIAYRVTLGDSGGFVVYGAFRTGEVGFYLDGDVGVELTTQAGDVVTAVETSSGSNACAEIRARHVFALDVGTYFLELAPDAAEVTVVVATEDTDAGL